MSENIMMYDAEQKRIDIKLKDSLIMVQEYRNKAYEDKTKDCRNVFEKAKQHRNERLAYYENKPKEYKAIKRYGEVLEKVERLLGIIPEPKKEFKLEDLASKMKELITARTKVTNQTTFSYFQNLLTNSITNILNIERDFQSGAISEKGAKSRMGAVITELRENRAQIPNEMMHLLGDSFNQAMKMADMYEKTFANIGDKKQKMGLKFVDTDLTDRQKIVTSELNVKTQTLMDSIASLDSKMCDFEPQVDLTTLTKHLEKSDQIMEGVVFDPDNLDSVVTDIELTTENLTSEQNYKNQQSASLTSEIESVTFETEKLSKECIMKTAFAVIESLDKRFNVTMENSNYVKELVEDGVIDENIAQEIAGTMIEQSQADFRVGTMMQASNPGVPELHKATKISEMLEDCAEEIVEVITEKRRERNPDWDSDEDDNDDSNRRN